MPTVRASSTKGVHYVYVTYTQKHNKNAIAVYILCAAQHMKYV
jgi:hypothetical protein